ncbi:phosphodiester glycosidase family protein [Arthrobacter sp. ISL-5]|uniref:phosphodiester glycosidase family protein n=1 Tax=Arthrobacter sp. ISL-5 TaxID=2819111 RepID=UPI0027E00E1B|nr:phosphodiester glycosidase family protein [Arthrobacter sp. ISL-5]
MAGKLEAAGIQARVEHVQSPQLADAGGDLGYRVRAGQFASKADGAPAVEQIKAASYASSVLYTGWDGDAGTSRTTRGPWKLEVLTIDPKQFRGQLTSGFGPNLQDRETTSQLAAGAGALAATNGGYFDATCTDPDEIVAFTQDFGPSTPSGPGLEVVLDEHGTVKAVNSSRGIPVPARGRTVQAIGTDVQKLGSLAKIGTRLKIDAELVNEAGRPLQAGSTTDVVNGGPVLVSNGAENITAKRDGMVRQGDSNSFYYGWVHKRNPRTIAGVDAQGRTLLVTADGRQTTALGLSIKESADVARSLGMVDAINLDGGGSTTMVVNGQVVNSPSDAAGQRPVGDALLVLPRRRD